MLTPLYNSSIPCGKLTRAFQCQSNVHMLRSREGKGGALVLTLASLVLVAIPFVGDKRENGKQNEIPQAINCATANIRRHNSLHSQAFWHHLNVNSTRRTVLVLHLRWKRGRVIVSWWRGRHVTFTEFLHFIFSRLHSYAPLHNVWRTPLRFYTNW